MPKPRSQFLESPKCSRLGRAMLRAVERTQRLGGAARASAAVNSERVYRAWRDLYCDELVRFRVAQRAARARARGAR